MLQSIRIPASLSGAGKKHHRESTRLAPTVHSFYAVFMINIVLSLGMLAGFALIWGAWRLLRRDGLGQKVWLMIAAAMVIFANVAIWTVPDEQGQSLVNRGAE